MKILKTSDMLNPNSLRYSILSCGYNSVGGGGCGFDNDYDSGGCGCDD